jgi:hypothetical protein
MLESERNKLEDQIQEKGRLLTEQKEKIEGKL